MVSTGHAWSAEGTCRAQASHSARLQDGQATSSTLLRGQATSNRRRDRQATRRWFHHGGVLPRLAGKPSPCDEEERNLAHVYRLHLPEQGMPQGSICSTLYRSIHLLYG